MRDEASSKGTMLFFISWWSNQYNRPLKDPMLLSYTLEELMYEYYVKLEQVKHIQEIQENNDKIVEEKKWDEAEKWADQMEAEDLAQHADTKFSDLPENEQWMEEQLAADKEVYGEEFGDDLNLAFDEGDDG